jgi:CRISPR-associated protein Csb2
VLALAVEFLTGRYTATAVDDRDRPEWPPHPIRLFSALVAAWAEGGKDETQKQALQWLERQPPPALTFGDCYHAETRTSYVPVNDRSDPTVSPAMGEGFPLGRLRAERAFSSVTMHPPIVHFVWGEAQPTAEIERVLVRLASTVSYLGHSSSLVAVRHTHTPPTPTLVPVKPGMGNTVLRVPSPHQLDELERAYGLYVNKGIRGRLPAMSAAYAEATTEEKEPSEHGTVFGHMVVLRRREGPHLPVTAAEAVARTLRGATMAAAAEPIPEALSGHTSDGGRSERPHVAYIALPDVGHRHADGHLLGMAVVLPWSLDPGERRAVLGAIISVDRLVMGSAGVWWVERVAGTVDQRGLRPETWIGPAMQWASVTPVELDIHPDEPYGQEAESCIRAACQRIGLPSPASVLVTPQSIVLGSEPWYAFRPRGRASSSGRPLVHVVVTFGQPVRGPVLLGAGRYRGLGLCRPAS